MAYFFTKTLLQLFRFKVLCNLSTKLAEVVDKLSKGLDYVAFEISKVDKNSEFFWLYAKHFLSGLKTAANSNLQVIGWKQYWKIILLTFSLFMLMSQ